jgi:MFS family permease
MIGYRELLRTQRSFRLLWFGQIVSLFGDWFNLIATAALLSELTGTGAALGGLFAVRMLAPFFASPVAGILADRYNRKNILIATDALRAVVVLGFLLVRDAQHVWMLFALTAVQLWVSGIFFPVRVAMLPDVAPGKMLGAANALSSATWSGMLAVGAAAGGLFSGFAGIHAAFVVDAATFALSALILLPMRYSPPHASPPQANRPRASLPAAPPAGSSHRLRQALASAMRDYAASFRYLRRRPRLLILVLQKSVLLLFAAASFQVITVAIATNDFPIGAAGGISLGLLFGASGVGSGLLPLLVRTFIGERHRSLRVAMVLGYAIAALGMLATATLHSFPVVLVAAVLRGVGGGLVWIFSTQLLLEIIPADMRGRVVAIEHAGLTLLGAAGAALAGVGLAKGGVASALVGFSVLTIAAGIVWAMVGMRGDSESIGTA